MLNTFSISEEYQIIINKTPIPKSWTDKVKHCPNGTTGFSYNENRYMDILAKTSTQVKISKYPYINANHIILGNEHFIACQAPLETTIFKHWLMIWDHQISVSVMLTGLIEKGIVKANQYWPSLNKTLSFVSPSDKTFNVKCVEEQDINGKFIVRKFAITYDNKLLYHYHIHYLNWPDDTAPTDLSEFNNLIEISKIYRGNSNRPMLVHCSAGIGRTGTFLACYYNSKYNGNIRDLVLDMRQQRFGMVQTPDQYLFIYKYSQYLFNNK
jgi:protein tyrosine phosphatase